VLAGSDTGELRRWDLEAAGEVDAPARHHLPVTAVALSADGRVALSAGQEDGLLVWDLDRVAELSGADSWLALTDGNGLPGRNGLPDGNGLTVLADDDHTVTAAALDPTGTLAVTGDAEGRLTLWDLTDPASDPVTFAAHHGPVGLLAVGADGRHLASGAVTTVGDADGPTLVLWDLDRLRASGDQAPATRVIAAAVASTGRALLLGDDLQPCIVDPVPAPADDPGDGDHTGRQVVLRAPSLLRLSDPIEQGIDAVALSADGNRAALGALMGLWSWEPARSRVATRLDAVGTPGPVAITADGSAIVAGGTDELVVWRSDQPGRPDRPLGQTGTVTAVAAAVTAGGLVAVSAADDATMRLWDLAAGRVTGLHQWPSTGISALALVPGDEPLALTGWEDGTVVLWAFGAHAEAVMEGHSARVTGLAVSGDGRLAASCALDRTVRVWDIETMERLAGFTLDAAALACALTMDGGSATVLAADAGAGLHRLTLGRAPVDARVSV
jgi:WD40 repeat protein